MEKVSRIQGLLDGAPYRSVDPKARQGILATRANLMRQRRGETADAASAFSLAAILDSDLTDDYGSLAMDEVQLALDWGMRGEWGDYTAVTAANLYKFVRKYAESDERREAVDRLKAARTLPPKEDERSRWVAEWYEREMAKVDAARARRHAAERAAERWGHWAAEAESIWRKYTSEGIFPAVNMVSRPALERLFRTYAWLQAVGLAQKCLVWAEVLAAEDQGRTEAVNAGMDEETGIMLGGAYALRRVCANARARGIDLGSLVDELRTGTTDEQKAAALIGRRNDEKS